MASLTTHVLDTAYGHPAGGMLVALFRVEAEERVAMIEIRTNDDGRSDQPLLAPEEGVAGAYELDFHVGEYFRRKGIVLADPPFLDIVTIRFGLAVNDHYHVPLLISPYGYSTYRGS